MPINLPPGVSLHPNTSTRNRVQPTGDFIPLSVRAAVGQTQDLVQIVQSDGTTFMAQFQADTTLLLNRFLALKGDVSGGTGNIDSQGPRDLRLSAGLNMFLTVGTNSSSSRLIISQNGGLPTVDFQTGGGTSRGKITGDSVDFLFTTADSGGMRVVGGNAAGVLLTLQGIASQTGKLVRLQQKSSTTVARDTATLDAVWADSTDATRKGRLIATAEDASGTSREGWRIESSGSAAMLGFLGQAAAVRQAGASAAGIAAVTDVNARNALTALQAALGVAGTGVGLITSPA